MYLAAALIIFAIGYSFWRQSERKAQQLNEIVVAPETEPQRDTIYLWDRTTVTLPNISKMLEEKPLALYVTTFIGENPDFSLIRVATNGADVYQWEYKTSNKLNLQMYLIFALLDAQIKYPQVKRVVVFSESKELFLKIKIQGISLGIDEYEQASI